MIKKSIITLLQAYKKYLSPFLGNNFRCRFCPTCSEYAVDAVEQHGVLCGGGLIFKRLLRCHPWSKKAGYDPVPETKNKKREKNDR